MNRCQINKVVNETMDRYLYRLNEYDDTYTTPNEVEPKFMGNRIAMNKQLKGMDKSALNDFDNPDVVNSQLKAISDRNFKLMNIQDTMNKIVGDIGYALNDVCEHKREYGKDILTIRNFNNILNNIISNGIFATREERNLKQVYENNNTVQDYNNKVKRYKGNIQTNRELNAEYYSIQDYLKKIVNIYSTEWKNVQTALYNVMNEASTQKEMQGAKNLYDLFNRLYKFAYDQLQTMLEDKPYDEISREAMKESKASKARKVIRLNEKQLQAVINESVKRALNEDKVEAIRFNWNISVTPEGAKKMYELYEKLLRSKFVLDFEADSERTSLSQTSVIR